jgi:3-phosphoshikimate 1-carboxyvinyltransferase
MIATVYPGKLKGAQVAPASKSSMQRACAAALLHVGQTIISNPGHSNDDLAAMDVIQKLGAQVEINNALNENGATIVKSISITSKGVHPIGPEMNCGESGLGIRMFTPIAALSSQSILINGKGSLVKRPMHFFDEIFPALGVIIQSQNGYLPIQIQGPLKPPETITVDGSLSSQFLTGLLMAYAASGAEGSVIKVLDLKSKPYIDLTLSVLNSFGWKVQHDHYEQFSFLPHEPLKEVIEYTVEGDWSGAAFLLVAGAIAGPIIVKGLQMESTQADKAVMHALQTANISIAIDNNGIKIGSDDGTSLRAFDFDATDCPDLFPPLVALAANCIGVSEIKGVSRLAHKESDRGLTLQTEFAKLGIQIDLEGDIMKIHGGSEIKAATVFSQHDHRIAMACSVAALRANGPVVITDAEAINKSYTDFFDHLIQLGGKVEIG